MVDNRTAGDVGVQYCTQPERRAATKKKRKTFLLKNATEKTGDPGPFLYLAVRPRIDGQAIKPNGAGEQDASTRGN